MEIEDLFMTPCSTSWILLPVCDLWLNIYSHALRLAPGYACLSQTLTKTLETLTCYQSLQPTAPGSQ